MGQAKIEAEGGAGLQNGCSCSDQLTGHYKVYWITINGSKCLDSYEWSPAVILLTDRRVAGCREVRLTSDWPTKGYFGLSSGNTDDLGHVTFDEI